MTEPTRQRPLWIRGAVAVVALVVVAAGAYLVLDAFTTSSVTFRFVDEVVPQRQELRGKRLKISGAFVGGSRAPAGPGKVAFEIEKGGFRLAVVADEAGLPGGFDVPGRDVVIDGTLDAVGTLRASLVTTGCPSRYEGKRR